MIVAFVEVGFCVLVECLDVLRIVVEWLEGADFYARGVGAYFVHDALDDGLVAGHCVVRIEGNEKDVFDALFF